MYVVLLLWIKTISFRIVILYYSRGIIYQNYKNNKLQQGIHYLMFPYALDFVVVIILHNKYDNQNYSFKNPDDFISIFIQVQINLIANITKY